MGKTHRAKLVYGFLLQRSHESALEVKKDGDRNGANVINFRGVKKEWRTLKVDDRKAQGVGRYNERDRKSQKRRGQRGDKVGKEKRMRESIDLRKGTTCEWGNVSCGKPGEGKVKSKDEKEEENTRGCCEFWEAQKELTL